MGVGIGRESVGRKGVLWIVRESEGRKREVVDSEGERGAEKGSWG